MKKILLLTLIMITYVSVQVPAQAMDFPDVTEEHPYAEEIYELVEREIISGSNGYIKPDRFVTRGQASKMMYGMTNYLSRYSLQQVFSDVPEDYENFKAVHVLYREGIVNGYEDGTFGIHKHITRAHVAKMLANLYQLDTDTSKALPYKDVDKHHWSYPYIQMLYTNGVLDEFATTTFKPNEKVTRSEMAYLLVKMENIFFQSDSEFIYLHNNEGKIFYNYNPGDSGIDVPTLLASDVQWPASYAPLKGPMLLNKYDFVSEGGKKLVVKLHELGGSPPNIYSQHATFLDAAYFHIAEKPNGLVLTPLKEGSAYLKVDIFHRDNDAYSEGAMETKTYQVDIKKVQGVFYMGMKEILRLPMNNYFVFSESSNPITKIVLNGQQVQNPYIQDYYVPYWFAEDSIAEEPIDAEVDSDQEYYVLLEQPYKENRLAIHYEDGTIKNGVVYYEYTGAFKRQLVMKEHWENKPLEIAYDELGVYPVGLYKHPHNDQGIWEVLEDEYLTFMYTSTQSRGVALYLVEGLDGKLVFVFTTYWTKHGLTNSTTEFREFEGTLETFQSKDIMSWAQYYHLDHILLAM